MADRLHAGATGRAQRAPGHDPRRGETNYRLTNVKRGEPDAALMKVPADYARSGVRAAASAPRG